MAKDHSSSDPGEKHSRKEKKRKQESGVEELKAPRHKKSRQAPKSEAESSPRSQEKKKRKKKKKSDRSGGDGHRKSEEDRRHDPPSPSSESDDDSRGGANSSLVDQSMLDAPPSPPLPSTSLKKLARSRARNEIIESESTPGSSSCLIKTHRDPPVERYLVPFADPIAELSETPVIYEAVKRATYNRCLLTGIKETQKFLRRFAGNPNPPGSQASPPGVLILAADTYPWEIIAHMPILAEDARVPYLYVRSRDELGRAGGIVRVQTSAVIVLANKRSSPKDLKSSQAKSPKPQKEEADPGKERSLHDGGAESKESKTSGQKSKKKMTTTHLLSPDDYHAQFLKFLQVVNQVQARLSHYNW